MIWKILIILLIAFNCHAEVFSWTHDCLNTTGFRIYYGESSGQNNYLYASVSCPNLNVIIPSINQGYYIAKAYNQYGESEPSNEVLWAGYYYNSTRYEYDLNGKILYKGEHTQQDASVDDTNWIITKYYWSGNNLTQMRIRMISWSNRAMGW